jgi:hypothetical protein
LIEISSLPVVKDRGVAESRGEGLFLAHVSRLSLNRDHA